MTDTFNDSRPPKDTDSIGLAVASLILGIISIPFSLFLVGAILAITGSILGGIHLKKRRALRAMATWGIILSIVGLLASVGLGSLYYHGYKQVRAVTSGRGDNNGAALEDWQGVRAPDFSVTSLDGKEIRLADLCGKRVVLDFWATWCPPCVKEIPHFIRLVNDPDATNLVVVGISSEAKDHLARFCKEQGINYSIASGKDKDLLSPYKDIRSIPTTFFVDRNGVIQTVFQGYHDYEALKAAALAEDFKGDVREAPAAVESSLLESSNVQHFVSQWALDIPDCRTMCTGDWDGHGTNAILVVDGTKQLHVVTLTGQDKARIALPQAFSIIEVGQHATQGTRLLGYSNWGKSVTVCDTTGRRLWEYATDGGVDGAHWGDLDCDGTDELIVGMNGRGGLHVVSCDGKVRWKVTDIGNVWNQAIVSGERPEDGLVFATEAGGSIRVYDSKGNQIHVLRPLGGYYAQMTANVMDNTGRLQVIALGDGRVVGFDPQGKVFWTTAGVKDHAGWRHTTFACGDLDGDGVNEWVFREPTGKLVVASPAGVKLASLSVGKEIDAFAVASVPGAKGRLVTMSHNTLQAYALVTEEEQSAANKTTGRDVQ